LEEGGPVREDVVGGQGGDVFEETLSGPFGLTRPDPERVEAVAHGVEGKGQKVHRGEHHGEALFAVAKIVLQMIAVVFQNVETFVLDFPARPCAVGDVADIVACDGKAGDKGAFEGDLAFGVAHAHGDPVDVEGVFPVAQGNLVKPLIMQGDALAIAGLAHGFLMRLRAVDKVVQRLVRGLFAHQQKIAAAGRDRFGDRLPSRYFGANRSSPR
jgi:hypothetical protein